MVSERGGVLGGQTPPRAEDQSLVVLAGSVSPTLPGLSLLCLCLSISPFIFTHRGFGFGGRERVERFLGGNKETTASSSGEPGKIHAPLMKGHREDISVGPTHVPLRAF